LDSSQAHDLQKGSQVTIDINKYPSSANFAFGESKIKPKQTTKQAAGHEINIKAIKDVQTEVRRYNIGRSAFHHLFMKAKNMMEAKILR
jgi:hypothetical protein